jgi:hypothetical protein
LYKFEEDTTLITFANKTTSYPKNTLKTSVWVTNWPFRALSNSLVLEFSTVSDDGETKSCQRTDSSEDSNSNLNWISINVGGVVMYLFYTRGGRKKFHFKGLSNYFFKFKRYGEFEHNAEVDGTVRPVAFALKDNVVSATVPHFWVSMGIYPFLLAFL